MGKLLEPGNLCTIAMSQFIWLHWLSQVLSTKICYVYETVHYFNNFIYPIFNILMFTLDGSREPFCLADPSFCLGVDQYSLHIWSHVWVTKVFSNPRNWASWVVFTMFIPKTRFKCSFFVGHLSGELAMIDLYWVIGHRNLSVEQINLQFRHLEKLQVSMQILNSYVTIYEPYLFKCGTNNW